MEQHEEKRVRSFAESVLFYVGIPAAALYPLGVLGVGIELWRDPRPPTPAWTRCGSPSRSGPKGWCGDGHKAPVPRPGVRGLRRGGVRAVGAGTPAPRQRTRGGLRRGQGGAEALDALPALTDAALGGGAMGERQGERRHRARVLRRVLRVLGRGGARVRLGEVGEQRGASLYLNDGSGLLGGVAAAICLAATQTPPLPLVEIKAERDATLACEEVPIEDIFVMLDRGTRSCTSTTTKTACSACRKARRRPCVSGSAKATWTGTDPEKRRC